MSLPEAPGLVDDTSRDQKRQAARCVMRHIPDGPDRKQVMNVLFQPATRTVPLDTHEQGSPEEDDAVRAWAAEHGIYVSKYGRLPRRVVAMFRQAVAEPAEAADSDGGPR
jgi:hypothetical protein